MARTKETWNLNLNHASNVFVHNGKVSILVNDPDDTGRQIFVRINCNPYDLGQIIGEKALAWEAEQTKQATAKKISQLEAIVNGDFPEQMKEIAMNELAEMGAM